MEDEPKRLIPEVGLNTRQRGGGAVSETRSRMVLSLMKEPEKAESGIEIS